MRILLTGVLLVAAELAQAQYSGAYGCTQDCSGHEAGYEWAERNGIDDVDDCRGKSQSFIEGCWDYVEQQTEQEEEDSEEYYVDEDGEECDPSYDDECQLEDEW